MSVCLCVYVRSQIPFTKDYLRWNFDSVRELLEGPLRNPSVCHRTVASYIVPFASSLFESLFQRCRAFDTLFVVFLVSVAVGGEFQAQVLQALVSFLRPSKNQFCSLPIHPVLCHSQVTPYVVISNHPLMSMFVYICSVVFSVAVQENTKYVRMACLLMEVLLSCKEGLDWLNNCGLLPQIAKILAIELEKAHSHRLLLPFKSCNHWWLICCFFFCATFHMFVCNVCMFVGACCQQGPCTEAGQRARVIGG